MSELKNCPACGGEATSLQRHLPSSTRFYGWGECCDCGVRGPAVEGEANAVDAWNALPRKEDAAALVEALRDVQGAVCGYWSPEAAVDVTNIVTAALNAYEKEAEPAQAEPMFYVDSRRASSGGSMTKTTFTPGPWECVLGEDDPDAQWEVFADAAGGRGRVVLVATAHGVADRPMPRATAHLIAAAPELYAACEAFTEAFMHRTDDGRYGDAMSMAVAALVKARGGE